MFKLLTISLAGVRSLTIFFLLLLLFLWLVGFFFFFFGIFMDQNEFEIHKNARNKKAWSMGFVIMVKIGFSAPIAKHKAGFSLCRSPTCGSR